MSSRHEALALRELHAEASEKDNTPSGVLSRSHTNSRSLRPVVGSVPTASLKQSDRQALCEHHAVRTDPEGTDASRVQIPPLFFGIPRGRKRGGNTGDFSRLLDPCNAAKKACAQPGSVVVMPAMDKHRHHTEAHEHPLTGAVPGDTPHAAAMTMPDEHLLVGCPVASQEWLPTRECVAAIALALAYTLLLVR